MNAFQDFASSLSEDTAMALAVSLLLLVFLLIVSIVLMIIAAWKIFVKAGEKGWKILIPFYSMYVQCRIARIPKIFWIDLPVMILLLVLDGQERYGRLRISQWLQFCAAGAELQLYRPGLRQEKQILRCYSVSADDFPAHPRLRFGEVRRHEGLKSSRNCKSFVEPRAAA